MKLSEEVRRIATYSGNNKLMQGQLYEWADRIAELEAELAEANKRASLISKQYARDSNVDKVCELTESLADVEQERDALREQYLDMKDRLDNGIKYDEELNVYTVVWTARELEQAQKEADEICKVLGIGEKALKEVEG